ncbi:MAG: ATP synthase subunit I [Myxococcota bacterium]
MIIHLTLAAVIGVVLSIFFFGGLWWTLKRLDERERPAIWMLTSFLVRTTVVLAGFYAVTWGRWEALAVCAATFIAARFAITRVLGRVADSTERPAGGGGPWS